jgi:hypothetical protein
MKNRLFRVKRKQHNKCFKKRIDRLKLKNVSMSFISN